MIKQADITDVPRIVKFLTAFAKDKLPEQEVNNAWLATGLGAAVQNPYFIVLIDEGKTVNDVLIGTIHHSFWDGSLIAVCSLLTSAKKALVEAFEEWVKSLDVKKTEIIFHGKQRPKLTGYKRGLTGYVRG